MNVWFFARWPRDWERIPSGVRVGAALYGLTESSGLLMCDADGVLWLVARGTRAALVRWCLERGFYVYPSLDELSIALRKRRVVGLLVDSAPRLGVPWSGAAEPMGDELVGAEAA